MTTTKPRTCKYHPGQAVEFAGHDFKTPGMPRAWFAATVEQVTLNDSGKTFDVRVRVATDGRNHVETVGVRGGNQRIRAAA